MRRGDASSADWLTGSKSHDLAKEKANATVKDKQIRNDKDMFEDGKVYT